MLESGAFIHAGFDGDPIHELHVFQLSNTSRPSLPSLSSNNPLEPGAPKKLSLYQKPRAPHQQTMLALADVILLTWSPVTVTGGPVDVAPQPF